MTALTRRDVSRYWLGGVVVIATGSLIGCSSSGAIDAQAVINALKSGCGILVPIAKVTDIINASVGATVQGIVDLICSAYKSSLKAKKLSSLEGNSSIDFVVVVNGKEIEVTATPAK